MEENHIITVPRSDIDVSLKYFGSKYIAIAIVDCISYKAAFTNTAYSVGSSYMLQVTGDESINSLFVPYIDRSIDNLTLIPDPFPRDYR